MNPVRLSPGRDFFARAEPGNGDSAEVLITGPEAYQFTVECLRALIGVLEQGTE